MVTNETAIKSVHNYICEICNFTCSRVYDYNRHNSTRKHEYQMNANVNARKSVDIKPNLCVINTDIVTTIEYNHVCNCGKKYKHMSSLCKHRRICSGLPINNIEETNDVSLFSPNVFMELMKRNSEIVRQNEDFKQLLIEQNAKIVELSTQPITTTIINTTNNDNSTQNNQTNHFNLHFFLNEQCKDAMNLSEFITQIKVDMDDIKYIDQFGYTEGMTNIIVRQINETDIYKRPIHCTDLKRETMYIKNDNKWTKEGPNQENLHKIINSTYRKNQNTMQTFFRENPQVSDTKSPDWDYYMRLMRTSMGGSCEYQDARYEDKIIKSLARIVFVNKIGDSIIPL